MSADEPTGPDTAVPDERLDRSRSRLRLLGVIAMVLLLVGVGTWWLRQPRTPWEHLAVALRHTVQDDVAFRFSVEADASALATLGEGAADAATFLAVFEVAGALDRDDGGAVLSVDLVSEDPLVEVRRLGPEALYLRLGLGDLLTALGIEPDAVREQTAALGFFGVSPEVQRAVDAALEGSWVGIVGSFDAARIQALLDQRGVGSEDEDAPPIDERLGGDVRGFLERYVEVEDAPQPEGEVERYLVSLRLRALVGAVTAGAEDLDPGAAPVSVPERLPGVAEVTGGVVTRLAFDIGAAARQTDPSVVGSIQLVLDLTDHGDVPTVEAPDEATVVEATDLQGLFDLLIDLSRSLSGVG